MTQSAPCLFILSPGDCDALNAAAKRLGWRTVGARRLHDAEGRFLGSDARVALVDGRTIGEAAERVRRLGPSVEAIGGALIVLIHAGDAEAIDTLIAAGATHCLLAPFDDAELNVALKSARETVRRLNGEQRALTAPPPPEETDYLTGLANRRAALDWLDHALGQGGAPPVCLLVGMSQFDAINAAYGQSVGDGVLARVAQRIARTCQESLGREDIVARVAGTEFLVGIRSEGESHAASERALLLARHIVAAVAEPYAAHDEQIRVTARCGIAEGLIADDGARLLRRAAAALADARRSGVGDICLRTTDRRGRGLDLDRLDADLRLALGRGEIGVVFQPQYDARSDAIVGVEALARWNHPKFGQLGAAVLFDAAERSDYLLPLSRHIQREALYQAGGWPQSLSAIRLSINVTAVDLAQADFVAHLLAMVTESGFPADRVTVEITESGLIENIDRAATLLEQLRTSGMRVAMDDFGTGYSSLAYLKALPLDYLKIDSGLTRDIAGAPRDRVIVRGIIAMAKSLSLKVIAEGVENEEQLTLLAREGCDVYQGFLRSAGVEGDALVASFENTGNV